MAAVVLLVAAAGCGAHTEPTPAVATAEPQEPTPGPAPDRPDAVPDAPGERPSDGGAEAAAVEPGRGGGGIAATCLLLDSDVLPRCASGAPRDGCPLDLPATAGVAIEVTTSTGFDELGTHAFGDIVPLLLQCFGEALETTPDAAARVQVRLDVAPGGCARVRRTSGDWPTRHLRDCTCGVLSWRTLPAPTDPDGGTLDLTIDFTP